MTSDESYAYCRRVARRRAKNFYYAFVLLDGSRRNAMCAIYAFMRYCDDLADEPGAERAALDRWRLELAEALEGRFSQHPVWPALHDAVRRYAIPPQYLFEMIEGVSSDLEPRRIQTFDELYRYCYQVAAIVGMTIIHIFGFDSKEALWLAERRGIAFQLTNILRDVAEDSSLGRVYLPADDMSRFGVTSLIAGEPMRRLLEFEASRARGFYAESAPLEAMIDKESRPSLRALTLIYTRLLDRIERSNYDVLSTRIRVPGWEKAWIVASCFARTAVKKT